MKCGSFGNLVRNQGGREGGDGKGREGKGREWKGREGEGRELREGFEGHNTTQGRGIPPPDPPRCSVLSRWCLRPWGANFKFPAEFIRGDFLSCVMSCVETQPVPSHSNARSADSERLFFVVLSFVVVQYSTTYSTFTVSYMNYMAVKFASVSRTRGRRASRRPRRALARRCGELRLTQQHHRCRRDPALS